MTKDVLVSISGMHEEIVAVAPEIEEDENEAIEVVTPATYYLKNGKTLYCLRGSCRRNFRSDQEQN